jgi:hypothetical protein
LFVKGTWVFYTFHEGWNEIHPKKRCQIVAKAHYVKSDDIDWDYAIASYLVAKGRWKFDPADPAGLKPIKLDGPPKPNDRTDWVKSICHQTDDASNPGTVNKQGLPENQWQVHLEIDGCQHGDRNNTTQFR